MPPTTYRLLGPISVERDGTALDLGSPKQRMVLAMLLVDHGHAVSTDRLEEALWGQTPPAAATASVQAYVSRLRSALREPDEALSPIVRRGRGYALDVADDALDTTQFVRSAGRARDAVAVADWDLAAAAARGGLALWRGQAVEEFRDEHWVDALAAGLEQRRRGCEADLVTALLGQHDLPAAAERAGALARSHPLDERACWLLALTRYREGRTADALAVLGRFRDHLGDELGLDPGPALRDLQQSILQQDPSLEGWPDPAGPSSSGLPGVVQPAPGGEREDNGAGPGPSSPGASGWDAEPLVGRAAELERVRRLWASGSTSWTLVTGPAGIGKTRLAAELTSRWLAGGGIVTTATCPDDPSLPTWWPLRQVLIGLGLSPDAAAEMLTVDANAEPGVMRYAVFERVAAALVAAAAERPCLVVINDLQWADTATVALVSHLVTTCTQPDLSVVLTSRPDLTRTEHGTALITAVSRHPHGLHMELAPLADADVAQLVAQVGDADFVSHVDLVDLARRTGGNPFFVTELARLGRSQYEMQALPTAVRLTLAHRLDAVPAAARSMLQYAAIAGGVIDVPLLRAVTGSDTAELADLLDLAADEYLVALDPSGATYVFAHALIREQLLSELTTVGRQRTHLQIAATLLDRHDPVGLTSRAHHLQQAGPLADVDAVVTACVDAAENAEARWESEEAAGWWEAALDAHDRAPHASSLTRESLVSRLVGAWVRSGQGQRTLDLLDRSLLEARRERQWEVVGDLSRMLLRLTGACPWPSYGSDPSGLISRLTALEAQMADQPAARARALAALAVGCCFDPDQTVPDRLSATAVALAESAGDAGALRDALLGRAMAFAGVADRAEETLSMLQRISRDLAPDDFDRVIMLGLGAMATLSLGDLAATRTQVEEAVDLATVLHLPISLAQMTWLDGALRYWQADDAGLLQAAFDAALVTHRRTELTETATQILIALTLRWEEDRLEDGVGVDVAGTFFEPWIQAAVAAARGDRDAPALLAAEVRRPEPTLWTSHGRWTLLAHAVADLDMPDLAPELIDRLRPLRRGWANFGYTGGLGPIGLAEARLQWLLGDVDQARDALTAAVDVSQRAGGGQALVRCRRLADEIEKGPARDRRAPGSVLAADSQVPATATVSTVSEPWL